MYRNLEYFLSLFFPPKPYMNIHEYSSRKRNVLNVGKNVIMSTSTFTTTFSSHTSTPAFVILFLHLLFSRFLVSAMPFLQVCSVDSELFSFALLIYFLFIHFLLEFIKHYWHLVGCAIASSSPVVLWLGFCQPGTKEIPAGFLFFYNAIIHMNSNPGNTALA